MGPVQVARPQGPCSILCPLEAAGKPHSPPPSPPSSGWLIVSSSTLFQMMAPSPWGQSGISAHLESPRLGRIQLITETPSGSHFLILMRTSLPCAKASCQSMSRQALPAPPSSRYHEHLLGQMICGVRGQFPALGPACDIDWGMQLLMRKSLSSPNPRPFWRVAEHLLLG